MSPSEIIDIVDDQGQPTGERRPRAEAHRLGLPHATVHVWIIDRGGRLLLQKRAALKDTFPNHWDISAAGHITAGDTPPAAAARECAEELGLAVNAGDLCPLFLVPQHFESRDGLIRENEWCHVYLLEREVAIAALQLQADEVAEAELVPWRKFRERIEAGDRSIVPHGAEYQRLFGYLEGAGF
jgi:isopentenyl-diphosphate delta-isomerase